jgi:hypothetical protein|tara:strand:- start:2574 stop:2738 length:165 start_codon:yes stop_codon:yes gene_type:complete
MKKKDHIETLEEFKDRHYGKIGTSYWDKLEEGYKRFNKKVLTNQSGLINPSTHE